MILHQSAVEARKNNKLKHTLQQVEFPTYIVSFWKSSGTRNLNFEVKILANQLAGIVHKHVVFRFEYFTFSSARI